MLSKPRPWTPPQDMATNEEESVEAQLQGQPKKHDHQQAAHLDKVTDYVEEQEISGDVGKAVSEIGGRLMKEKEERAKRDKELAKVVIRKEDVEIIIKELEIPKAVAERSLREHMGDVVKALHSLTD